MSIDQEKYKEFLAELGAGVRLVAVSKTKPPEDIRALYGLGQRDFGENYVQELVDKQARLPADIQWHFIGHLQSNKVKAIAPFVHLIHSVDSLKLLKEIDRQGAKVGRVIDCLLQVHIAQEETKFGFDARELDELLGGGMTGPAPALTGLIHARVNGLMGMASFTEDPERVVKEFRNLKTLWDKYFQPAIHDQAITRGLPAPSSSSGNGSVSPILSMGMSGDYILAIREGSNMVRIGSLLFGSRDRRE